jgi:hypothetical protein
MLETRRSDGLSSITSTFETGRLTGAAFCAGAGQARDKWPRIWALASPQASAPRSMSVALPRFFSRAAQIAASQLAL